MFRELVRKNKALSKEECLSILEEQKRGVLSVIGDEGYPYGMPLNHFYDKEDGKLYFHSAQFGHKVDSIKKDARVSYCVMNKGELDKDGWSLHVQSVIVFGKAFIVEDKEKIIDICKKLSYKFGQDDAWIKKEIEIDLHRTLVFGVDIEYMTGKNVHER